jgi:hypothetical protein
VAHDRSSVTGMLAFRDSGFGGYDLHSQVWRVFLVPVSTMPDEDSEEDQQDAEGRTGDDSSDRATA